MCDTITKQELFDRILAHSRKMTKQSGNSDGCFYRSKGGKNCCFVGVLITDEVYADYNKVGEDGSVIGNKLEGKTAAALEVRQALERSLGKLIDNGQAKMLAHLQWVHDSSFENREQELKNAAVLYGLEYREEEK